MKKENIDIMGIPAVIWGEKSDNVYIAVHGDMSNKEDTVIEILSEVVNEKGYQVLSFDLPEHGDRKESGVPCKIQYCVYDFQQVLAYAGEHWKHVSLFGCSQGAYFSLVAYQQEKYMIDKALFLSPIVDMKLVIENMMQWFAVTLEELEIQKEIQTPIKPLYWDYYSYVANNPIHNWDVDTRILYGAKDEISDYTAIQEFEDHFSVQVLVKEEAEHFFHTPEQLKAYKEWLKDNTV